MSELPQFLQPVLGATPLLQYGLLFIGVGIEGPLLTMIAGWGVSAGVVNPVVAYPVILLADIVSDSLYYALGHGGRASIKKMPGRLISKIPTDKFKRIAAALKRNPGKTILFGKWTHVAGIFFLMTAGAARLRFRTFLFYDTLATIPKSLVFFLVGYYSGESIDLIDRYLSYGTLIISGWLILLCILYVVGAKYIEQRFLKID